MATALTLALNKGRILEEALPLLAKVGIAPAVHPDVSRQLVLATKSGSARLVIARGWDVPTFVGRGVADLGVVGKDILMESATDHFYEPVDLGIACCRLVRAVPANAEPVVRSYTRVATKYANSTRDFYADMGRQVEIVALSGTMEIAPMLGLADEIVDIVDTGGTLAANDLVEKETLANISARIIVNKASMKRRFQEISALLDSLMQVI